jgi:hypothetical protein
MEALGAVRSHGAAFRDDALVIVATVIPRTVREAVVASTPAHLTRQIDAESAVGAVVVAPADGQVVRRETLRWPGRVAALARLDGLPQATSRGRAQPGTRRREVSVLTRSSAFCRRMPHDSAGGARGEETSAQEQERTGRDHYRRADARGTSPRWCSVVTCRLTHRSPLRGVSAPPACGCISWAKALDHRCSKLAARSRAPPREWPPPTPTFCEGDPITTVDERSRTQSRTRQVTALTLEALHAAARSCRSYLRMRTRPAWTAAKLHARRSGSYR